MDATDEPTSLEQEFEAYINSGKRDGAAEDKFVRWIRRQDRDRRLVLVKKTYVTGAGDTFVLRCIDNQDDLQALLLDHLQTGDASSVNHPLRAYALKLSLDRIAAVLERLYYDCPQQLEHVMYWLPGIIENDPRKAAIQSMISKYA